MNIKYMMLKDRYKFIYGHKVFLYNIEDNLKRAREISLFVKELGLYGVSLKSLSKLCPSSRVKDELLNIAYICIEDTSIYDTIRSLRGLPVTSISEFSSKSKSYIEKWSHYLLAYIILLSNNNYNGVQTYLNIKKLSSPGISPSEQVLTQSTGSATHLKDRSVTGIVMKCGNYQCYIMTPYGDFIRARIASDSPAEIGAIYSGTRLKNFSGFKYPLGIICLTVVLMILLGGITFLRTQSTILIHADSSIKLETNRFNRVIKITPLSTNGNKISHDVKLFNKTLDRSLFLILKTAKEQNIIKDSTKIMIYINGSGGHVLDLPQTDRFIIDYDLNVQINNNGKERKVRLPLDN